MLGFVAVVSVGASSGRDQAPDWIYGTWRWKFSGVSFVLNNETPASCRCNRYLQFHRDGTYEYIAQGSAHEFLLASGKAEFHDHDRYQSQWVSLEHGLNEEGSREESPYPVRLNLLSRGRDVLRLTSGPGVVLDGGESDFIRSKAPSGFKKRLPLQDRPRRLRETALEHFLADSLPYESPPVPIKQVLASYPESLRAAGRVDVIVMEVIVNEQGQANAVVDFRGPAMLLNAAFQALLQWRFEPARGVHGPVAARTQVEMRFQR